MPQEFHRIYVEKRSGFDIEAMHLKNDLVNYLGITELKSLRVLNMYDIYGIDNETFEKSKHIVFSEPTVDSIYTDDFKISREDTAFAVEYLPGQYDQRADSAEQCIKIINPEAGIRVKTAKLIVLSGNISKEEFKKIKEYCINPVDSREASLEEIDPLDIENTNPAGIEKIIGFTKMDDEELEKLLDQYNLAMHLEDMRFCREYFSKIELRDPTMTEIRVIDTYWSDHCRHTTFLTEICKVEIEESEFNKAVGLAYEEYLKSRKFVYGGSGKPESLMDIATIGMKELRVKGLLNDLDVSDEINACSIIADVDIDGEDVKYLIMFKNETHNHPTEIEPFGGAATCLGGAIRDPLSGRAFVYQAMRVTGSGDPRKDIHATLQGKLPQKKITTEAAHGYSSYGNQIGLATGQVSEIYDEGFIAKRMEIGAVIGAVPKENVVRETPREGDRIILLGGRTGRDGCGGATGSSKEHTEDSIYKCGSEVQKGNPPTERKLQRLFRNPEVTMMIKRCNDFGAGGVAVAIGELADGLEINLDNVPKKYDGLDGTELAISESQERMAAVISHRDIERFIKLADEENVEATVVAQVIGDSRLKMQWRGEIIVDLSREFLNSNGAKQKTEIYVKAPAEKGHIFDSDSKVSDIRGAWLSRLSDINICSQKGLVERFDSTIGAGTVLMPFGGKYQMSPQEGMAAKVPIIKGRTNTGTLMSYGYNPEISKWSPFHGAVYSVVEAVSKIAALGGDYRKTRLTLQEYFEKPGRNPERWGKPFSALLGALHAQKELGIPAIGGKDSMSGTFKELDVPPTLVAFAVNVSDVRKIVSAELKEVGSNIVLIKTRRVENNLPDFDMLRRNCEKINNLVNMDKILAASSVRAGGIVETISKMSFGNRIGVTFKECINIEDMFSPGYGSFILELSGNLNVDEILQGIEYSIIGHTNSDEKMIMGNIEINLDELIDSWESTLENIFPSKYDTKEKPCEMKLFSGNIINKNFNCHSKPRVFIPVFPGTNCEYDSARAFEAAGGIVDMMVFRNLSSSAIEESIGNMINKIRGSQIIMLPGGFSAGDEPDGSGKFIAAVFRNPGIAEAVMELLNNRDGLTLGICNGFQALIKLGLLPYGEIKTIDKKCPTLTYNSIGRHVSGMVNTKIISTKSPWLQNINPGDIFTVPVSHGEGRFIADSDMMDELIRNGQVATQYVDLDGRAAAVMPYNPNGSSYAVEGITSPDGRVFGKMAHSERIGEDIAKNIPGRKNQLIFESGIKYFK